MHELINPTLPPRKRKPPAPAFPEQVRGWRAAGAGSPADKLIFTGAGITPPCAYERHTTAEHAKQDCLCPISYVSVYSLASGWLHTAAACGRAVSSVSSQYRELGMATGANYFDM